jgi:hypothetical protein
MGAAGLAVGGLAGAYLEHEHGMFFCFFHELFPRDLPFGFILTLFLDEDEERSDVEDAYEAGRRDEAYEDDYGSD